MLDPTRIIPERERNREQLFTRRYEALLAWALRLTNQDRASAEDLVQDAFIQFVLGRTSLEKIENIDGYLRRMLRYMHLSRISRNVQKTLDQMLSLSDYDSFNQSWRATEPSRQMQTREELWQVCSYACARKETSRAGAVLILRFFHEYYPSEIARVLCSSRHCVDQWQRLARSELKLYMSGRRGLRFLNSKAAPEPAYAGLDSSNGDLIGDLRRQIFHSRQGECLPTEQLQKIYQLSSDETLRAPKLGHIVSCRACLDAVNQILDIPLLAERYQSDSSRPGEPPSIKPGGDSSSGGPTNVNTQYKQRLREVAEHEPKELRIFVNGSAVGSLKVSSNLSELDLCLIHVRRVEFVEIFSEQDIRLLFFSVSPSAGPKPDQWATIELSEGRTLKAFLRCESGGPILHIVYQETALQEPELTKPLTLVKQNPAPIVFSDIGHRSQPGEQSLVTRLTLNDKPDGSKLERLRRALKLTRRVTTTRVAGSANETITAPEVQKNDYKPGELTFLSRISPTIPKPFWAHPAWLTVLFTLIAVGVFMWYRTNDAPTPSAVSLLEQASAAEKMNAQISGRVTHRIINLEVRRITDGLLVSRQKIEVWQDSARGERAQRVYDESGRLIAGAWQSADGARTIYHHGTGSRMNSAEVPTDNLLLNLDDVWQLELSATEFRALVRDSQEARMIEQPSYYMITFDHQRVVGASRLLKATLTLNRTDLRAIKQTLLVQRGGEGRAYHFVEASFELLPQSSVEPAVFEPERTMEGRDSGIGTRGEKAIAPAPISSLARALPVASAELEVDVAYLLNQAKADRREQISLSRSAAGLLSVEGIVDTEERKAELIRAFAPVSNNPAVKIEIVTVTDALKRRESGSQSAFTVREEEETDHKIAVDNELRTHLSRRDATLVSDADLDEAVRSFSSRNVDRSYRALFHAIELKRLVNRFAGVDMRTITLDARTKWLQMVREHAIAVERETGALRREIQPVFFPGFSSGGVGDELGSGGDVDLARVVEQLHKLALSNNEAIRAALMISSHSSSAQLKSTQFWRSLMSAEKLAARVKHYRG